MQMNHRRAVAKANHFTEGGGARMAIDFDQAADGRGKIGNGGGHASRFRNAASY